MTRNLSAIAWFLFHDKKKTSCGLVVRYVGVGSTSKGAFDGDRQATMICMSTVWLRENLQDRMVFTCVYHQLSGVPANENHHPILWVASPTHWPRLCFPLAVAHAIGNIGPHGCPLLGSPCTVWEGLHYNRYSGHCKGFYFKGAPLLNLDIEAAMVCFPNTDLNKLDVGCSALVGTTKQSPKFINTYRGPTHWLLACLGSGPWQAQETSAGRQMCLSRNCAYSTIAIPTGMMMIINSWI